MSESLPVHPDDHQAAVDPVLGCNRCGNVSRQYTTINGRDYCYECAKTIKRDEPFAYIKPLSGTGEP